MNVYDYAIKMEQTSETYYRGMADDCSDIGLKTILTMLADEEAKHRHALAQMKAGQSQNVQSRLLSPRQERLCQDGRARWGDVRRFPDRPL